MTITNLGRSKTGIRRKTISVDPSKAPPHQPMRRYVYEAANVPWSKFNDLQPHSGTVAAKNGRLAVTLPAKSMTFITSDYLDRIPDEIEDIEVEDGILKWQAAEDAHHRYCRVCRNGEQIASTVATSLKVGDGDSNYRVRSVDRWLNVGR